MWQSGKGSAFRLDRFGTDPLKLSDVTRGSMKLVARTVSQGTVVHVHTGVLRMDKKWLQLEYTEPKLQARWGDSHVNF